MFLRVMWRKKIDNDDAVHKLSHIVETYKFKAIFT